MYVEEKALGEVKTFSQVMNKAADLIEERGHSIGSFYNGDRLCMYSAVYEAAEGRRVLMGGSASKYHVRLERWLGSGGGGSWGICNYNNTHTQSQVVSTLRKAATEA